MILIVEEYIGREKVMFYQQDLLLMSLFRRSGLSLEDLTGMSYIYARLQVTNKLA